MNKEILRLAVPSMLANITVPIVGIVDLAIAGHISDASAIGGIAVGTMLFDLLYWNFGFLRVGTGGMTAQAFGRGDRQGMADIFSQSMALALAAAVFVLAVGWLFVDVVMLCMPHSAAVESFARAYFNVRIWAAPATLSLMAFKGWFIGSQNTVAPMTCDITVNVVNMLASYVLAVFTPLGAIGVAYGTLIAQYTGLLVAISLFLLKYKDFGRLINLRASIRWKKLERLLVLNGNLFLRSLGFMVVYVGFTALTSYYGDATLAVGAIMMKIFMLFSFFIDGFAYAGEALVGRFIGAQSRADASRSVRLLFLWAGGVGVVFTLLYIIGGEETVRLMTSDESVVLGSRPFLFWLALMPLVSCAAFMWDGVYIGATAGKQVRDCMLFAAIGFVASYVALASWLGVQAVFVGYFVHLLVRTLYLTFRWKGVLRRAIPLCLLLCLSLPSRAQDEAVIYEPIDSTYLLEIERLMEQAEKEKEVRKVMEEYKAGLNRYERSFHTEGLNYLIRGAVGAWRDRDFRHECKANLPKHDADYHDYAVAFAPLGVTWALKALGVESRSTTQRMVVANATTLGLTFAISSGLKSVVDERRPNGENDKSMPSRHAAMAFASATILHREYGDISPWISVGGYATATATQYLRLRHNAHWMHDVYMGAGIGAVSANLAYFITDRIVKDGVRPARLTMDDIRRTLMHNLRPTSLTLVSGVETGGSSPLSISPTFTTGLEYSHFFDERWAAEAIARIATCNYYDRTGGAGNKAGGVGSATGESWNASGESWSATGESWNAMGAAGNIDLYHLDAGVKYSRLLAPSFRLAGRVYGGMRWMDCRNETVGKECKGEFGAGLSFNYMRKEKYAVGLACDYNHAFSDWMRHRFVINLLWQIVL